MLSQENIDLLLLLAKEGDPEALVMRLMPLAFQQRRTPAYTLLMVHDKDEQNIVHYAAQSGAVHIIRWLMESPLFDHHHGHRHLILNAATVNRDNAMMTAARSGHSKVICELYLHGLDVDSQNDFGITPLIYATLHNHLDAVQALLDLGADPTRAKYDGETALHIAARQANLEVAKLLRASGASVLAANASGDTPASLAQMGDDDDIREICTRGFPGSPDLTNQSEPQVSHQ